MELKVINFNRFVGWKEFYTNPLHGVERGGLDQRTAQSSASGGLNPLHGVERIDICRKILERLGYE